MELLKVVLELPKEFNLELLQCLISKYLDDPSEENRKSLMIQLSIVGLQLEGVSGEEAMEKLRTLKK